MAFVPVADTAKVALLFTQYNQKLVNTLWFHRTGGWDAASLTSLCTAINSWVVAEMLSSMNNTVTYNGSEAVDMTAEGQEGAFVPVTSGNVGTKSGDGLPSNVTAAIAFKTGFTGRSNRGRNFFIGLDPDQVAGDSLTPASIPFLTGIYDALASYLTGLAAEHVVASLYHGIDGDGKPIPRAAGIIHAVTSYFVDSALDSMRRRLIGRGT